ncbi:MAG: hypothetical protein ABIP71_07170 [Verrucomicrobiota bacterium]
MRGTARIDPSAHWKDQDHLRCSVGAVRRFRIQAHGIEPQARRYTRYTDFHTHAHSSQNDFAVGTFGREVEMGCVQFDADESGCMANPTETRGAEQFKKFGMQIAQEERDVPLGVF